jgi:hypothetical protein
MTSRLEAKKKERAYDLHYRTAALREALQCILTEAHLHMCLPFSRYSDLRQSFEQTNSRLDRSSLKNVKKLGTYTHDDLWKSKEK